MIELKLGLNRLGRSSANDFAIEHATISSNHCEILLDGTQVKIRDCQSTNGTFVSGRRISEAVLETGQTIHLGDVELFVETTEVRVEIPKFELPRPAPPVVLDDGSMLCPRHPKARATHQCAKCLEILCDACVHKMRRRGGKVLKLCPICSSPVQRIGGEPKRRKSILDFLQKTVKLPFMRERTHK